MDNSTKCPDGVEWCQQHDVLDAVDDDGQHPHRHTQWLYTKYAPVRPDIPATAVYVSDVPHRLTPAGPGICLQQFENPPQPLTPVQARELAAALMRGAELVEAARTATCPGCGQATVPADLLVDEDAHSGDCGACRLRRFGDHQHRRAQMKVIK